MDRILAFGCHPDDIEFMAAGTLALLAREGYEVHLATMTGGEVGSATLSSEDIRNIRLAECDASAAVIGATYHYAGGCDLQVEYSSEYRKLATRVVREVDPLIVLTQPPSDYLADHEQTSLLVRNAAYIASVPLYDCGAAAISRIPYLYYWKASGLADIFGRPLPVHFGVDVSDTIDIKERMLACHRSQGDWLKFLNGVDSYTQRMRDDTAAQGRLIGRAWGECFIQHRGMGHPADNILKKILGERVVELPAPSAPGA
jgi:LmbE family N-acetylglucosaminyl deacetylase